MSSNATSERPQPLRVGIILGTTRVGRFSDKAADWLLKIAHRHDDAVFELVDLRDYPLPFFDEPRSPMLTPPTNEIARRWGKKLDELDAFVFITAEYNHSVSAVLKNALDYAYPEFNRKPAAFVGYGNAGGARAVEQLRLILAELQVASLKHAVHVGYAEFVGMLMHDKTFADFPYLETAANTMLTDLVWWATTLRSGRRGDVAA